MYSWNADRLREKLQSEIDFKDHPHEHIWMELHPVYGKTNYRYCALCHEPGWVV